MRESPAHRPKPSAGACMRGSPAHTSRPSAQCGVIKPTKSLGSGGSRSQLRGCAVPWPPTVVYGLGVPCLGSAPFNIGAGMGCATGSLNELAL